jgi:hypothetical protein
MESKDKIRKLIKIDEATGEKYTVYPITYIQAIIDENGDRNLDDILASYNAIYVEFNKDFATTMKVVPEAFRTKGRQVTYIVRAELKTDTAKAATFIYNSNKIEDEEFCNADNWITLTGGDVNFVTNEIASVTNNSDNLDIVTVNKKLQLGDGTTVSGTNLYILRPKDINADDLELDGSSIAALQKSDVLCVVKYNFTNVVGDNINIGARSGLLFAGGTMRGFTFNVNEPYKIMGHYDLVKFLADNSFNGENNLIFDGQFNLGASDIQQIEGDSWKKQAVLGKIIYNKDEDKLRAFTKDKIFSITENEEYLIPSTELNFNFIVDNKPCTEKEAAELSKIKSFFKVPMRTKFYFYDSGTSPSTLTHNYGYYQVWVSRDAAEDIDYLTFHIPFYDGRIRIYRCDGVKGTYWKVRDIYPYNYDYDKMPYGTVYGYSGDANEIVRFKGKNDKNYDAFGYTASFPVERCVHIITNYGINKFNELDKFMELIYDSFSTNFQTYEESIVEKTPIIVPANLRDFVINICNIDFTDKDSNDNQTFDVYKNISRIIVKDNALNDGEQLLNNYRVIKYGGTNDGSIIYYKLRFEIDSFYKRSYHYILNLDVRIAKGFLINRNNVDIEPITILGSCYVMPLYTFNNPPVIQKPISLREYQNLADPDDNTEYLIFE